MNEIMKNTMHIVFSSDDQYAPHLAVVIASILKNSQPNESFSFYVLTNNFSKENETKIRSLNIIKDFKIDFCFVNDSLFDECPIMLHFSKQTYYRYLIPKYFSNLERILYLDSDIIVRKSLINFYNKDFLDNYAVVVRGAGRAKEGAERLGLKNYFNAGVMLINVKKWKEDDISNKLFENTILLSKLGKIKAADQCVINYTLNDMVVFVDIIYNFTLGHYKQYYQDTKITDEQLKNIIDVYIAHFTSNEKPWTKSCIHPYRDEYFDYLKLTPFF